MKLRNDGYYTNRHSCFLLQYHLVLVTKYRHPVICGPVEETLKQYIRDFFEKREMPVHAFECMPDHVHILFDAYPNVNLAELINALKSASSRTIRKLYPEKMKQYYWKPYFWSQSYFIGTVSDRTADAVEKYINNLKNK